MSRIRPQSNLVEAIAAAMVLGAAALSGAGCAAHVRPGDFSGSPDSSGLAVIVCVVEPNIRANAELDRLTVGAISASDRDPVDAGTIVSLDAPDAAIRSTTVAGVLVFPRLREGTYRIRSLLEERRFLERDAGSGYDYYLDRTVLAFDPRSARDLTFHVATGELTYVGVIVVRADYDATVDDEARRVEFEGAAENLGYRLEPDDEREWNVWNTLLRWYRGTPWERPIEDRIRVLESRRR